MGLGLREFRRRTEEDRKSKVLLNFKQYIGIQSANKEEMNMYLEQRRRGEEIRRIYNYQVLCYEYAALENKLNTCHTLISVTTMFHT